MAATLRQELTTYLTRKGIRDPNAPPDQLYPDDWFRFYVGSYSVPVWKLGSSIQSLAVHDAHHLLTGYGTDMCGEAALAGWELASGGCGRHWVMWVDRVFAALSMMVFYPRASLEAIRRGRRERNLYHGDFEGALGMDFDEVQRRIRHARPLDD